MKEAKKHLAEWDAELNQLHERNGDLGLEVQNLKEQLAIASRDREENQKSLPASEIPDAADLLNRLKAKQEQEREQEKGKRKKPKPQKIWELKDIEQIVEVISEMIEG